MDDWMDRMFRETWTYYAERRALPKVAGEELAETTTPFVDIKDKEGKIVVAADVHLQFIWFAIPAVPPPCDDAFRPFEVR